MTNDERDYFRDLSDWTPAIEPGSKSELSQGMEEYLKSLPDIDFSRIEEPAKPIEPATADLEYTDIESPFEHEDIEIETDNNLWDEWEDIYEDLSNEDIDDTYGVKK